jgi:hypothetical protein
LNHLTVPTLLLLLVGPDRFFRNFAEWLFTWPIASVGVVDIGVAMSVIGAGRFFFRRDLLGIKVFGSCMKGVSQIIAHFDPIPFAKPLGSQRVSLEDKLL